jgi:hypothetical protein
MCNGTFFPTHTEGSAPFPHWLRVELPTLVVNVRYIVGIWVAIDTANKDAPIDSTALPSHPRLVLSASELGSLGTVGGRPSTNSCSV